MPVDANTEEKINEILEILKRLEARIATQETRSIAPAAVKQKPYSIKEFVIARNPNNDTKKTLAIGYFLEKYENLPSFNIRDLETGFRNAKEKVPLNMNDKVNGNIRNGHVMEAEELKDGLTAWTLTSTGERFVENNFETSK
ncbi:MAG: hypothetical protein HY296_04840 [Thaumarchaeota archaeon]|nr:hypothetical protein [Nitrososphaerota archaeon]